MMLHIPHSTVVVDCNNYFGQQYKNDSVSHITHMDTILSWMAADLFFSELLPFCFNKYHRHTIMVVLSGCRFYFLQNHWLIALTTTTYVQSWVAAAATHTTNIHGTHPSTSPHTSPHHHNNGCHKLFTSHVHPLFLTHHHLTTVMVATNLFTWHIHPLFLTHHHLTTVMVTMLHNSYYMSYPSISPYTSPHHHNHGPLRLALRIWYMSTTSGVQHEGDGLNWKILMASFCLILMTIL